MQKSENGLVPARGFLETCMAPRPEFNDGVIQADIAVQIGDGEGRTASTNTRSLRTPISTYGKRVRYAVLEFEELLDSSSIDSKGWTEIARTIARNYTLFDGFVVLHGTDSLAYTCSALSFMLQNLGKPVVFTGTQTSLSTLLPVDGQLDCILISISQSLNRDIADYMLMCCRFTDSVFRAEE